MNAALLLAAALSFSAAVQAAFEPVRVPGTDVRLIPESQRSFERVIIGLESFPPDDRLLGPGKRPKPGDPRYRELRDELYWLQFELLHGRILTASPPYSRFFLAVPLNAGGGPGGEEASFRRYLETRVGWSREEIRRRALFFPVASVLRFPRDMAEPIGRDARERLVLAIGSDADEFYADPVRRLAEVFPNEFHREILNGVNTEGGDVSVALFPQGKLGVVVGYHRLRRWAARRFGASAAEKPLSQAVIEEAKRAFRGAFFGLETFVVGEEELRGSTAESEELFHADMVLNTMRGSSGIVAFIPTYPEAPVDATTFLGLSPEIRSRAQSVYDRAARRLAALGFHVVRIPFRDHPDRSPVQAGAFVDLATGQQKLLLGRYPYHFLLPEGFNPQQRLQREISEMEAALADWRAAPGETSWKILQEALRRLRRLMDDMPSIPNPDFDAQARIYEAEGIHVIPVTIYPTGEGGIHCLLLN